MESSKGRPQVIRSLIPPDNSAMFNKYQNRGRNLDVKHKKDRNRRKSTGSMRPPLLDGEEEEEEIPQQPRVKITDLPTEILNQIMDSLDQKEVLALMQSCKALVEIAAEIGRAHV